MTAADLRAMLARERITIYKIAAAINLHPSRLSLIINEHAPLTPELALRITQVIEGGAIARQRSAEVAGR